MKMCPAKDGGFMGPMKSKPHLANGKSGGIS
jgi:hypothetical protein